MAVNAHADHCYEGEAEDIPCCKEISQELRLDELVYHSFDFDATPDRFELTIINHILLKDINSTITHEKPAFQNYDPPFSDRDIPILIQSFLI